MPGGLGITVRNPDDESTIAFAPQFRIHDRGVGVRMGDDDRTVAEADAFEFHYVTVPVDGLAHLRELAAFATVLAGAHGHDRAVVDGQRERPAISRWSRHSSHSR